MSLQRRPAASFGTKAKTQSPEFEKKFLELSQLLSPKPTKRDTVSPDGTRLETAAKTGCNWSDGTLEPKPSSGNRPSHPVSSRTSSRGGLQLVPCIGQSRQDFREAPNARKPPESSDFGGLFHGCQPVEMLYAHLLWGDALRPLVKKGDQLYEVKG